MGLLAVPLAAATGVHEYELDNGMKVLIKTDRRAPVVVAQVWYRVGASYEWSGITGVSHVLEHMMFKGTKKHAAGEFSRIIAAQGGRENAFTSRDYTAYFQTLEKSRLPVSMEMEADRMHNLVLQEEEFAKEIKVVMEERRTRTDDQPRALTYEQLYATAFNHSGYHHPTIGWMNDLEHLQVQDLQDWYRQWYAPNNATLVVVGDVVPEQVYALAQRHYGVIPKAQVATLKPRMEAPQQGQRRVVVEAPAKLPFILMGYKVPVLATAEDENEVYALDVLAGVLDGGDSARFSRDLIRGRQLAASAGASYGMHARSDDLFSLQAIPANGHSIAELEAALREHIDRVSTELVDARELKRIKAQVIAAEVYEKDSLFYQGMALGILETVGLGWQRQEEYVEKIKAVTAEQVRDVARKYLVDTRLTVAILKPLPLDPDTAPAATAPGRH
ncbi:MAG: pitrilysin family protein [Gammaproteobacteria bacterium]